MDNQVEDQETIGEEVPRYKPCKLSGKKSELCIKIGVKLER